MKIIFLFLILILVVGCVNQKEINSNKGEGKQKTDIQMSEDYRNYLNDNLESSGEESTSYPFFGV